MLILWRAIFKEMFRMENIYINPTLNRPDFPVIGIMLGNVYSEGIKEIKYGLQVLDTLLVSHEVHGFDSLKNPDAILKYAENAEKKGLKAIVVKSGDDSEYFSRLIKSETIIPVLIVQNSLKIYTPEFVAYETILDACRVIAYDDEFLTSRFKKKTRIFKVEKE